MMFGDGQVFHVNQMNLAVPLSSRDQGRNVNPFWHRRGSKLPMVTKQRTRPLMRSSPSGLRIGSVMPKKTPDDQCRSETQSTDVVGPFLRSPLLGLAAVTLDDVEHTMLASQNRLRQLLDTSERGFGLTEMHPDVIRLASLVGQLEDTYGDATKNLQRIMRQHPLFEWSATKPGIGEKQFARLLAAIGDPYWNDATNEPRRVSQLWAYCGYHVIFPDSHATPETQSASAVGSNSPADQPANDTQYRFVSGSNHPGDQEPFDTQSASVVGVAPVRRRGMQSNWSGEAKMRAYLCAESCIRQAHSPYRAVYDAARVKYAEALHQVPCVRCGPAGHPAQVGSELNLGHKHARGLRAVSKAILRDLWIEARRLHEQRSD
jgi:hypothetical protein